MLGMYLPGLCGNSGTEMDAFCLPYHLKSSPAILLHRADVGQLEEAAAAAAGWRTSNRLSALLHAGGILDDALTLNQTANHVRKVYAPKASGGLNLAAVSHSAYSLTDYKARHEAFFV